MKPEKVALCAVMIALALIFSYVEAILPINFGVPGIKLGLANLAILAALYLIGIREAFIISVVRIILAGFLFGNLMSIGYSLAGGICSLFVMILMMKVMKMSIPTVSVAGGITHNVGQIILAMFIVENLNLFYYIPILLIAGILTGLLIGIVARVILPQLKKMKI